MHSFWFCYLIPCCLTLKWAFFIMPITWFHWSTQRALECLSQWQIPSWDTIHFALPLQLISLLLHSQVLLQLSILQSRNTLSWHSSRLVLTHYWLFFSRSFWSWWCKPCDEDSGSFSPQCLNHFPVARSLLMEGINISKAPGIPWVCYFGLLWKWQLTFKKCKAQG
jgi:hypothetical protein